MQSKSNIESCFHCGDPCVSTNIVYKDKAFCCRGCRTVFQILSDNDLTEYYEIENIPGIKKEAEVFSDFTYLDIPEIKEKLLTFADAENERVTLSIPGIHCSSCIWLLENLNSINSGILKSEVNFLKKEIDLQYKSKVISLKELAELLDSIGYSPLVELKEQDKSIFLKKKNLTYVYKIGIAGFAFGNIMLLSFPEYFATGMYNDKEFGEFFGYINLILSLPVFFYCSIGFFSSAWIGISNKYLNIDVPIALGILVLFLRSVYEVISNTGAGYFDTMTGLVFFLLIGRWFQNKSYQALSFERNYKSYFPLAVTKIEDGKPVSVLLKYITPNDELIIHNGEIIPVDSVLLNGKAFIDYSFVTGEADPVNIENGMKLFAGGRQRGEKIHIRVEKEFSQSYLMQLWKQDSKNNEGSDNLDRLIDRISHYFTAVILGIAIATLGYWFYINPSVAFHAFSSVLIIACPCALAMTIPFTYGNGLRLLERCGIYLKDAQIIEKVSEITTIVFDKTGTITSSRNKAVHYSGSSLTPAEKAVVSSITANSSHPLSRMIYNYLGQTEEFKIEKFTEVEGKGISAEFGNSHFVLGSSDFLNIRDSENRTSVYLKINDTVKGVFLMKNEYRPGLNDAVKELCQKHKVEVITGDGEGEKERLREIFPDESNIFFKMDPFAKKEHILKLKSKAEKVMMVGDGLNDAGAIKESNVGVSISDDVFGFLPACDVILESEKFFKLPSLIKFSVKLKKLAIVGFLISFTYNIVGLSFAVQGILSPLVAAVLMPLSSITIVGFAVLSTGLAARKMLA